MEWQKLIRDYLHFTRKDRISVLVLVTLIVVVLLVPGFLANRKTYQPTTADTAWLVAMKSLEQKDTGAVARPFKRLESYAHPYKSYPDYPKRPAVNLFSFDPNLISVDQWQQLGVREKTIDIIQHYLAKGGKFKKPEDLQRVYGLFPDQYEKLRPYIKIALDITQYHNQSNKFISPAERLPQHSYNSHYSIIDINTADTSAFISLPGIGSKLAVRIVTFREKLGGFYQVEQVHETFGLADSVFQKIRQYLKIESTSIRKININIASVDELKSHPYIRWAIANAIISYRTEHGNFKNIEELKKIMSVTEEIYNKLAPYLIIQ